jgi:deazaflavin-dependent oxidoreductase (nitroreductase family)
MPLTGEYEPSAAQWARDQVDLYESSGGTQGTDLNGLPVIILTSLGARTGKVRKTPLMRVEHDGEYAVVASLGGAPNHPVWYYNLVANPHVELQDGPVRRDYQASEARGAERDTGGTGPWPRIRTTRSTRRRRTGPSPCSSSPRPTPDQKAVSEGGRAWHSVQRATLGRRRATQASGTSTATFLFG